MGPVGGESLSAQPVGGYGQGLFSKKRQTLAMPFEIEVDTNSVFRDYPQVDVLEMVASCALCNPNG